jgi:hypothetical protein
MDELFALIDHIELVHEQRKIGPPYHFSRLDGMHEHLHETRNDWNHEH